MKNKQLRIPLIIFMLALLFRIAGSYIKETYYFHAPFIHYGNDLLRDDLSDSLLYNYTAKSIASGHGYAINIKEMCVTEVRRNVVVVEGDKGFFRHKVVPPVYPIFIAIFYYIFGINTFSYFVPQVLLGSITCCLVYFVAKDIFNEKVAVVSALMVALYPELIFWAFIVRNETLFIFLLALFFLLFLRKDSKQNYVFTVVMGIILGLACLTRIIIMFFVPIIFLWQYFRWEGSKTKALIWLFVFFCSFSLVVLPWAVRNYFVFNNFTPLTDEAGTAFLDYPSNVVYPFNPSANIQTKSYVSAFVDFVWHNPYEFTSKSLERFIIFMSPFTRPNHDLAKIYKGFTWIFIFPASFLGIFISARKQWARSGLLILFIFYYILIHSFIFVDTGLVYRYPILPFLCIFAAYAYWLIYDKLMPKKSIFGIEK